MREDNKAHSSTSASKRFLLNFRSQLSSPLNNRLALDITEILELATLYILGKTDQRGALEPRIFLEENFLPHQPLILYHLSALEQHLRLRNIETWPVKFKATLGSYASLKSLTSKTQPYI